MRFNSAAYDKVFPREVQAPKPESMVTNFRSNDAPNEKTVTVEEHEETITNPIDVEGGENNGVGNGGEPATE